VNQNTLRDRIVFEGVGIHSGRQGRVVVEPAEADTGRRFVVEGVEIPARVESVVDTARCTTLGKDSAKVSTVEHLLSALYAYNIDNAVMYVEGVEIPILDGSSLPYVEAIEGVGVEAQSAPACSLCLQKTVMVQDRSATICAFPADAYQIVATTTFDGWEDGAAVCTHTLDSGGGYRAEVAPARTFAFDFEVERLLASGLAQGGSLENALIISPPNGFSTPLRLEQEWCRHKILDVVGDLALLGVRLKLKVEAIRTGHRLNVRLAQALVSHIASGSRLNS
jgi:UDP-3-O-[3-hydroxymyristoyl] N-acetylglucosamine deacetylase